MPQPKQNITSIGHQHLPIFILQILLFVAVSCSIAYVIFTLIYGKPSGFADRFEKQATPVTAEDISAKESINESDFSSQSGSIDQQKLNNLFPEIK